MKTSGHYGYWCWKCSEPIKGDAIFQAVEGDPSGEARAHHEGCAVIINLERKIAAVTNLIHRMKGESA